ncbi:hypothetical protein C8Q80DRAFT_1266388 [Daedaleopsis nitida]|nr:hypothetical protein C8Q80DRAFT_1266388 [Daedaleopsis nitida]
MRQAATSALLVPPPGSSSHSDSAGFTPVRGPSDTHKHSNRREHGPASYSTLLGGEVMRVARGCQHGLVHRHSVHVGPRPIGYERGSRAAGGQRDESNADVSAPLNTIPPDGSTLHGCLHVFRTYQHPRRPVYRLTRLPRTLRGWCPLGPSTYALAEGGAAMELWATGQIVAYRAGPDAASQCPQTLVEIRLLDSEDAAALQRVQSVLTGQVAADPSTMHCTFITYAPFSPVQRSVVRVGPDGRAWRELAPAQPGDFRIGDWVVVESCAVRAVCPGRGAYHGPLGLRMSLAARDGDVIAGVLRLPGITDQA